MTQYLRTPRLRALLALSVAVSSAGAMVIVNTVVYVQSNLNGGATDTALAMASFGAGSMMIALMLPKLLDQKPDRPFMLIGAALLVIGLAAGSTGPDYITLIVIWFVLGIGSSLIQTPAGRLLKRSSNETNRTQIYAAQFALSHGCWLITYPLAGWLANLAGMEVTFLTLAFLCLIGLVMSLKLWPNPDASVLRHTHSAVTHDHVHFHDTHHQHNHEGWEGEEPHHHPHHHPTNTHTHDYVIDRHHEFWPR